MHGTGGTPHLDLRFARDGTGTTYLARQYAAWPFHVGRVLRLDAGPAGLATVVLQSLGAGLVRGDDVSAVVEAGPGAEAQVVGQGATLAHGTPGGGTRQAARLVVREGALLEFLPRPVVLFAGADVTSRLVIERHGDGRVLWADGFLGHDPKGGDGRFARYDSETVLRDGAGRDVAVDRFVIDGAVLDEPGTMAGLAAHAGIGVAGPGADDTLAGLWREALVGVEGIYGGVSALPGGAGLFCRVLAADGVALRRVTEALWRSARRYLTGAEPGARP